MTATAIFSEKTPAAAAAPAAAACAHCGEDCPSAPVFFAEKPFCCEGCKTVFEILDGSGLSRFYQIERGAGVTQKGRKEAAFAWLDDPEAAEKLLDFTDGKTAKITFQLPQIHCASCVWLLENLWKLSPGGILASKVNFLKREASVTFSLQSISLRRLVELLASIGYPPDLHLGSLERGAKKPASRRLVFQIGVAGFAFGNIMLMSFPEYLGLHESEAGFRQVFGWLNIALATPVAFYSGRDYLSGAWRAMRTLTTSIDIPLALGIVVLYFRSAFEIITGTGAGYMDSLAGLVFFLLLGKWFQQAAYHRISFERDYKSYFPIAAARLKDGREESLPASKLEPGDTILVRHGEIIPADGILKRGAASIDYSFVTGEAEPVRRRSGEKIYAGGRQAGEAVELLLTKKVSQSYLTQLWNEDAFRQDKLEGASRLANRVSRWFTLAILGVAFAALAWWLPKDARTAFNAFTAVLIIACPCAAALNVPFTLGNTLRILSRRGFFLKNTNVVEALHRLDAVVFDKTGTLTRASGSELRWEGEPLSEEEKRWVRALARQSSHPLSRQLAETLGEAAATAEVAGFQEFEGKGIAGTVREQAVRIGSKEFVFSKNSAIPAIEVPAIEVPTIEIVGLPNPGIPQPTISIVGTDGGSGSSVFIEINGRAKGSFQLRNRYRESAWDVARWFQKRSKTFLLSGDNERERAALAEKFDGLFFHQSPKDKLDFIKNLQARGQRVLMLGDGLNDAGALRQAEVGIVVAEDANNFTPACDAILDAREFGRLPQFLQFARGSIHLVYAAWTLAALYNLVGLSYAVQGALSPVVAAVLMPASALTIVAFGVGATSLLAKMRL